MVVGKVTVCLEEKSGSHGQWVGRSSVLSEQVGRYLLRYKGCGGWGGQVRGVKNTHLVALPCPFILFHSVFLCLYMPALVEVGRARLFCLLLIQQILTACL